MQIFAKLEDGSLRFAPHDLPGDGVVIYNPPAEMYLAQGWKPVTLAPEPEAPAGYYYESRWEEHTSSIIQIWELVEDPEDIDEYEAFDIIFGGAE